MKSESATAGIPVGAEVRRMFGEVAPRYDFLNSRLSLGLDRGWRRALVRAVAAGRPGRLLDLATGSGEVLAALRRAKAFRAEGVGADFCAPMLAAAREKGIGPLVQADGLRLPFSDGAFDAVTIAFGLRNLEDRPAALREIARVLAPGGVLHILEFSRPWPGLGAPYFFYLRRILPRLAAACGAPRSAYDYLGDSIAAFPGRRALADLLRASGYAAVSWRSLAAGTVALHSARKAE